MKLGLFSDVHEDIESLEKGLAILDKAMCTHLICLGDITGFSNKYYPYESTKDANSCINLIRKNCSVVISGNHDLFSAKKTSQFRAGIQYPENWFELNIEERKKMLPKEIWLYEDEIFPDLSPENIEYLSALPEYHIMKTATHKILFSHFLYPDISGSLRKKIDDIDDYKNHFNFMLENECTFSFLGHLHVEGFELINRYGYRDYGFRKKKIKAIETIIGLPSVSRGRNKNGVVVFDTDTFSLQAIRIK